MPIGALSLHSAEAPPDRAPVGASSAFYSAVTRSVVSVFVPNRFSPLVVFPLTLLLWTPTACEVIGDTVGKLDLPGQDPAKNEVLPLQINALSARFTDRFGESLRIEIKGQDASAQVVGAELSFENAQGGEVDYFDSDWDGYADTGTGLLGFSHSVQGLQQFTALIELPKILRDHPDLKAIQLRLLNADQHLSDPLRTDILQQEVRGEGESCDLDLVVDRCEIGLGCRSESGVCEPGQAPQITDFAYLDAAANTRILIAGTDPDADIKLVELKFLDADGHSVAIDLNNDGIAEETVFDIEVDGDSSDASFLLRMEPTAEFSEIVRSLEARPLDWSAQWGDVVHADFVAPVYRSGSATCDPRGFDQCVNGTVCYPGDPDIEENKCTIIQSLRQNVCDLADTFDLDSDQSGNIKIRGANQGLSLWEPPGDCSFQASSLGRPESVFNLHLPQELSLLNLSTVSDNTNFNTVLYLMPGCFSGVEQTLACNDDAPDSFASTIELQDLAAGDYVVVVDSRGQLGGAFELSINFQ